MDIISQIVGITFGNATGADGSPITSTQLSEITAFLEGGGSGGASTTSFADFLSSSIEATPAKLPAGTQYVAYSGPGAGEQASDYVDDVLAGEYAADLDGAAGTIGDTPYGEFVAGLQGDGQLSSLGSGLSDFLQSIGVQLGTASDGMPYTADQAIMDLMYNYGSPEFATNAATSGIEIQGFVNGASANRAFAQLELPILQQYPDAVFNGTKMSEFSGLSLSDALAKAISLPDTLPSDGITTDTADLSSVSVTNVLESTPNVSPAVIDQVNAVDPTGDTASGGSFVSGVYTPTPLLKAVAKIGSAASAVGEAFVFADIIGSTQTAISQVQAGSNSGASLTMATLVGRVEGGLYGAEAGAEAGGLSGAEIGALFGPPGVGAGGAVGGLLGGLAGGFFGYKGGGLAISTIWQKAGYALQNLENSWSSQGDPVVPSDVTNSSSSTGQDPSQVTNVFDNITTTFYYEGGDVSGVLAAVDLDNSDGAWEYIVYDPANFSGTITGFVQSDTIDLPGFASATGASISADNVLTVVDSYGDSAPLDLDPSQDFSDESFLITPDGSGGTDVLAESDRGAIAFTDIGEVLLALHPDNIRGAISNFVQGDTIDLVGISATSATLGAGNVLTVQKTDGTSLTLQLDPSQSYAGLSFATEPDDSDGTDITVSEPIVTSGSQTVTINAPVTSGGPIYTENVSFSPANVQFAAVRTTDSLPAPIPVTATLLGGDLDPESPASVQISVDSSALAEDSPFFIDPNGLIVGPDSNSGTFDITAENNTAGDYSNSMLPLYVQYLGTYGTIDLNVGIKVYAPAVAEFLVDGAEASQLNLVSIHVGQTASVDMEIANVATGALTDGLTTSPGTFGEFTAESGITNIQAGSTGTVTVSVTGDTAGLAAAAGTQILDPVSHDSDLPDQAAYAENDPIIEATVYNYADPIFVDTNSAADGATLSQSGNNWVLNLGIVGLDSGPGTISLNSSSNPAGIEIENAAPLSFYTDNLSGSVDLTASPDGGFIQSLLDVTGQSAPGSASIGLGDILPDSTALGSHTETFVFQPVDSNSTGFSEILPNITLTVTDDVVVCYLAGSHILTPTGEVLVEDLKIGDLVVTRFSGIQPIKWIGRQSYDSRFIRQNRDHIPVCIRAGALADHMPARDLYVSPGHSMLVGGQLVLAWSLVNGITITQDNCPDKIHYFQLELESHDCVIAEGAWSETFADGPGLREQFHNAAEFAELYPDQPMASELSLCALRPEHGPKLDAALRPVVARTAASLTPGPLTGYIDRIEAPWAIVGWAQDADHPELPVLLEVMLGDRVIATTLACDHRQDLQDARIGQGRSAFFLTSPIRLRPEMLPTLRVRRVGDGAEIEMTPECRASIEAMQQTQEAPGLRRVA